MKIRHISKPLLSKFVDFVIFLLIISIVIGSVLFFKMVLYPEPTERGTLTVRTELMPKEFSESISVGDACYDTLTKRRVGKISEFEIKEQGDKIFFLLTLEADFIPRSRALRTKELWFYFAPTGEEEL